MASSHSIRKERQARPTMTLRTLRSTTKQIAHYNSFLTKRAPCKKIKHNNSTTSMTYSIHKILTTPTRNRLGQDSNMSSFTKGFNRDCKWLRMTWTSVPPNTRTLAVTTSLFMSASRMGTRLIVPIPALEVRTRLSCGYSSQFKPKGQISTRAPQSRFTIHETKRGSQSCV